MSERVQPVSTFPIRPIARSSSAADPSTRDWIRHGLLFALTFITTTIAGVVTAAPEPDVTEPVLSGFLSYLLYVPEYYRRIVTALLWQVVADPGLLKSGVTFAIALLTILTAHEMGHYLACRRYGVRATLPSFIPAPPLFLAGTFGAFITMKSPIPSRRALFDIGLAGPLAGFVALVPVAVIGMFALQADAPGSVGIAIVFNDPLLIQGIAKLIGKDLTNSALNPFYM